VITATLLVGGRTAHSRLKIPLAQQAVQDVDIFEQQLENDEDCLLNFEESRGGFSREQSLRAVFQRPGVSGVHALKCPPSSFEASLRMPFLRIGDLLAISIDCYKISFVNWHALPRY